jgi:formylglycine-generating enzyme
MQNKFEFMTVQKVAIVMILFVLSVAPLFGAHQPPATTPTITSMVVTNNSVFLKIGNTGPGRVYVVQMETNLMLGPWINIGSVTNETIDPNISFLTTNILNLNTAQVFIRVWDLSFSQSFFTNGEALIPAGSFTMGDTLDSESDAVSTNIYMPSFYIQTNLVTYGQWQAVYYWAITNSYGFDNPGSGKGTNYPVEMVNWFDALKWCNARSSQEKLTPVYYTDAALTQVYTNGDIAPYVNWNASAGFVTNGFRLPTEGEWEKAARGGIAGQRFPWGDTISESEADYNGDTIDFSYDQGPNGYNANYDSGGYPYTSPAGSFPANGYGVFDPSGNVQEWCWDWYGTPYGQPTTTDPIGPTTGTYRVLRGGGWLDNASSGRCANRGYGNPNTVSDDVGFRCVQF